MHGYATTNCIICFLAAISTFSCFGLCITVTVSKQVWILSGWHWLYELCMWVTGACVILSQWTQDWVTWKDWGALTTVRAIKRQIDNVNNSRRMNNNWHTFFESVHQTRKTYRYVKFQFRYRKRVLYYKCLLPVHIVKICRSQTYNCWRRSGVHARFR